MAALTAVLVAVVAAIAVWAATAVSAAAPPARRDPTRWRTWRLVLWGAVVIPFIVFVALAVTRLTEVWFRYDQGLVRFAVHHHVHGSFTVWEAFSVGGSALGVIAMVTVAGSVLLVARLPVRALFLAGCVAAACGVNPVLKLILQRPRPPFARYYGAIDSWSFPSGHSVASMTFALALVVVLWPVRRHWLVAVVAVAGAVMVGVSRVCLGVHYPSDVLAGWSLAVMVVGVAWLAFGGRLESDATSAAVEPPARDAEPPAPSG